MPDWIATYKDVANTNAEELLKQMRKLATDVDDTVRWSYRRGLPPGLLRRLWLAHRVNRIKKLWGARFVNADPQV